MVSSPPDGQVTRGHSVATGQLSETGHSVATGQFSETGHCVAATSGHAGHVLTFRQNGREEMDLQSRFKKNNGVSGSNSYSEY